MVYSIWIKHPRKWIRYVFYITTSMVYLISQMSSLCRFLNYNVSTAYIFTLGTFSFLNLFHYVNFITEWNFKKKDTVDSIYFGQDPILFNVVSRNLNTKVVCECQSSPVGSAVKKSSCFYELGSEICIRLVILNLNWDRDANQMREI